MAGLLSPAIIQQKALEEASIEKGEFHLSTPRCLEIKVSGETYVRLGSMIAFNGDIKFSKGNGGGIGKLVSKALTGQAFPGMKAKGNGIIWVSQQGKFVQPIELQAGDELIVRGQDILAISQDTQWDVVPILGDNKVLVNQPVQSAYACQIKGPGFAAFTTIGEPVVMNVAAGTQLFCDPNAVVSWSGNLRYKTIGYKNSYKNMFRSTGEDVQLRFTAEEADGYVILQPFEEPLC